MKTKLGHMGCPDCGARVVVKINERETLSYRCDECDGNGYSKKGEGRYSSWMKKITRAPGSEPPKPAEKKAGEGGDKKPAARGVDQELS